jgi:catechol 2,3-dioxygenase-like lactoylglutathione lyase family enzyme
MPAALLEDVGQIAMRARDLTRATAFYRDTLGLKLAIEAPGMVFFQVGSLMLMLGPPENAEFDHPGSLLYFRTGDIAAAHAALVERGVTFRDQPHVIHRAGDRALWMAFFEDSEGNLLALMQWR